MPFSDYKVALVTGASAGMGEAIVERLCQEGIEVHAVARRHEQLAALADRTGCIPHAVDVGDLSALTALCQGRLGQHRGGCQPACRAAPVSSVGTGNGGARLRSRH